MLYIPGPLNLVFLRNRPNAISNISNAWCGPHWCRLSMCDSVVNWKLLQIMSSVMILWQQMLLLPLLQLPSLPQWGLATKAIMCMALSHSRVVRKEETDGYFNGLAGRKLAHTQKDLFTKTWQSHRTVSKSENQRWSKINMRSLKVSQQKQQWYQWLWQCQRCAPELVNVFLSK